MASTTFVLSPGRFPGGATINIYKDRDRGQVLKTVVADETGGAVIDGLELGVVYVAIAGGQQAVFSRYPVIKDVFLADDELSKVSDEGAIEGVNLAPIIPPVRGGEQPYPTVLDVDFDAATAMSDMFVKVAPPAPAGIAMTLPGSRGPLPLGTSYRVGNKGPGSMVVRRDSDATVYPAGAIVLPPGGTMRVNVTDPNEYFVDGVDIAIVAAPVNTFPPTIKGDNHVGSTLSLDSQGTWSNNPTSPTQYQWVYSTDGGTTWTDLTGPGATTAAYPLVVGDVGRVVDLKIWMGGQGGIGGPVFASNPVTVLAAAGAIPANTGGANLPSLSGNMVVAQQIISLAGTWTNTPSSYVNTIERADDNAGTNTVVVATEDPDANGQLPYTIQPADQGKWLRSKCAGRNNAGTAALVAGAWVQVPAASGSGATAAAVVAADMANYYTGTSGQPTNVDYSEQHCDRFAVSWGYGPRVTGGSTPLKAIKDATKPLIVCSSGAGEGTPRNTTNGCFFLADFQTWIQWMDNTWEQVKYSRGGTWWVRSNHPFTVYEGHPAPGSSGGGSSPLKYYLGTNPPAGFSASDLKLLHIAGATYDVRTGTGSKDRSNIKRILSAHRGWLDPANPVGKYVSYTGVDQKNADYSNTYDASIGRWKRIEAAPRVFTSIVSNVQPQDRGTPIPALTGVVDLSEYR